QAVPGGALLDAEPVPVQVGPRREDLAIDPGHIHAREALRRLLDQLREERAQPQAVAEVQRVTPGLGLDHGHAVARALAAQPLDERGRHVVGVDVDHRDRASASRRARFLADSGSSRTITPVGASAAATALAAAAPVATIPPSPAPFAPSGFDVDGASSSVMLSMLGKSAAVGSG